MRLTPTQPSHDGGGLLAPLVHATVSLGFSAFSRRTRTLPDRGRAGWGALFAALSLVAAPSLAQDVDAGTPDAADGGSTTVVAVAKPPEKEAPRDPLADLPAAQPQALKAVLEKAEVGLAEPFGYSIEIRHAPDETYELPAIIEWKEFHLRDQKVEVRGDDPKTTLFRLQIQAFAVGEREVPGFRLLVKTADGARQLEIPPQKIKVIGIIDPSQGDPKMREDHRPLPRRYQTRWWPLFVLAGMVALALGLVWWRRRASRPPPPPPPKPRPPPHVEALARLDALEAEGLVAKGEKQAYFFRVSEILRDYLGRRFAFDALELTSDELLAELRKRSTPGLDYDALAQFLMGCDLVKFARRDPTDGECKAAMDASRLFVQRTLPPPPVTPGGAA